MAYRIEYDPFTPPVRRERISLRLPLLTGLFFVLFLTAVKFFWPAGQETLTRLLLPLQLSAETQDAITTFLSDLQDGRNFRDALAAFCQQIVSYADIPSA